MQSNIYRQDGHPTQKLFLTDEELKRALLSLVKICNDFVPIGEDGTFYLPTRRKGNAVSEFGGPWFIGGAMTPFVDEAESTQIILTRELGREIDLSRLIYIRTNRYYFNGKVLRGLAHDAYCFTHALPLSQREIESVKLDPEEYEDGGLRSYGIAEILTIKDAFVRKLFIDLWNDPLLEKL